MTPAAALVLALALAPALPLPLPGAAPVMAAPLLASAGGVLRGQLPPEAEGLTLDGRPVPVDATGRWLIGFGRDSASSTAWLGWYDADGEAGEAIIVRPRAWPEEVIPGLAPRPVPDAEFDRRRPVEAAAIAAARTAALAAALATPAATNAATTRFTPPAIGPVTGVFGARRIIGGVPQAAHSGLDIGAAAGAPARAPAAGTVRLAAPDFTLEGNLVIIDHGLGLVSALLHLSRIDVLAGQYVGRGEVVGTVGATGRATGPHLHWSVTVAGVRVDPATLMDDTAP